MVLILKAIFWATKLIVTAFPEGEREGLGAADGEEEGDDVTEGDELGVGGKFWGLTTNHTPFIP